MRLIDAKTHQLLPDGKAERYAILSHTWEENEVAFKDMEQYVDSDKRFQKIKMACKVALESGLRYVWVDTCCINKSSSAELSEAINSMFAWYKGAEICLAFLSDLPAAAEGLPSEPTAKELAKCRWFRRGWTLQELIAPRDVLFLDEKWQVRGTKETLIQEIEQVTSVSKAVLEDSARLATVPLARRMSWAAGRKTTRVEDLAYCLMGIFDVNMPMIYGEGRKAFLRLQEEILKKTCDLSLLAWQAIKATECRGLLARSPAEFARCGNIALNDDQFRFREEIALTNKGIRTKVPLCSTDGERYVMDLDCFIPKEDGTPMRIGIWLTRSFDTFLRHQAAELTAADVSPDYLRTVVYLMADTDENVARGIAEAKNHRVCIDFHSPASCHAVEDISGVPSIFWNANRQHFLIGGLPTFVGFVRFTIRAVSGELNAFVLSFRLGATGSFNTMLYAESDFGTSGKSTNYINPFGDIDQHGPVGDQFRLAALMPEDAQERCSEFNVACQNNRAFDYHLSALALEPDARRPRFFRISVEIRITPAPETDEVISGPV